MAYSIYNVYYCKDCYKDILKSLEDSVEMPVKSIQKRCNTLNLFAHSAQGTAFLISNVEGITAKQDTIKDGKWKFTNDSRRKIIRAIKKIYPY